MQFITMNNIMLFQKTWNTEFSVDSLAFLRKEDPPMPPANCAVVFCEVVKFIPCFTVCTWSAIFAASQSIFANRQNIVHLVIQSFFKHHLIKL